MTSRALLFVALAAACAVGAAAQAPGEDSAVSGMSRLMQAAVMFYERGEDLEAMDRFMEILTQGDPSERPLANEYLNLITHRMNSGTQDFRRHAPEPPVRLETVASQKGRSAPPAASPRPAVGPSVVVEPDAREAAPPSASAPAVSAPAAPAEAAPSDRRLAKADKALMKKEIRARLNFMREEALRDIRDIEGVRVMMQENGEPQAIGIPSNLLFASGIDFRKGAVRVLDALTRMIFAMGAVQVYILPEGTAIGDAKILDMRRTMGVSAHLFQSGIATPRVKVNLLNSQVDIPRALREFKGIVLLFVYNRPMSLVVESALGEEAGPPITLGAYPQAFRPQRDEGVVIEFSVVDPPAGLVSWKFQLLQPGAADPGSRSELAPLQEVIGGGPVFHQIYWNGRRNYFGPVLPGGRYECVLTATDAKNRTRALHRWIQLSAPSAPAVAASSAPARAEASAAPSADISPGPAAQAGSLIKASGGPSSVLIAPRPPRVARKAPARRVKISRSAARAQPRAEPARDLDETAPAPRAPAVRRKAAAAKPAKPAKPGRYDIAFRPDSHQMTAGGERTLLEVAESVALYPLENLELTGYARAEEPDAKVLAERRAQMVAGLLINRHQIEPKRIMVRSAAAEDGGERRVEVRFVGKE